MPEQSNDGVHLGQEKSTETKKEDFKRKSAELSKAAYACLMELISKGGDYWTPVLGGKIRDSSGEHDVDDEHNIEIAGDAHGKAYLKPDGTIIYTNTYPEHHRVILKQPLNLFEASQLGIAKSRARSLESRPGPEVSARLEVLAILERGADWVLRHAVPEHRKSDTTRQIREELQRLREEASVHPELLPEWNKTTRASELAYDLVAYEESDAKKKKP